jgi:hypothetical protein
MSELGRAGTEAAMMIVAALAVVGSYAAVAHHRGDINVRELLQSDMNNWRANRTFASDLRAMVETVAAAGVIARAGTHAFCRMILVDLELREKDHAGFDWHIGFDPVFADATHMEDMMYRFASLAYGAVYLTAVTRIGPPVVSLILGLNLAVLALDPILGTIHWIRVDETTDSTAVTDHA